MGVSYDPPKTNNAISAMNVHTRIANHLLCEKRDDQLPPSVRFRKGDDVNNLAGYSGTPLAKKLGIKETFRVAIVNAPENYQALLKPLPAGVSISESPKADADLIHFFTNSRDELARGLAKYKKLIKQDGTIWVSWYKKAAKLPTEITEDTVRDVALPLGLVDVKVCAVDEKWSGLKLVIRRENRI